MKPNPNESYESWCERVRMFEHGHAMMQIAQGKDADKVMEEMGRRIMDKLLYPIFKAIRDDVKPFDIAYSYRKLRSMTLSFLICIYLSFI